MTNHQFIQSNQHKPLSEIALLLSKHPELDKHFILNQINGLQKAKLKLPTFYENENIIYCLKKLFKIFITSESNSSACL